MPSFPPTPDNHPKYQLSGETKQCSFSLFIWRDQPHPPLSLVFFSIVGLPKWYQALVKQKWQATLPLSALAHIVSYVSHYFSGKKTL